MTIKKKNNYNYIIKQITEARKKNNNNWMKLLKIAFQYAPDKAKKILSEINKQDRKINSYTTKLSKF